MSAILPTCIKMENLNKEPQLIKTGFFLDERGRVTFCNEFDFKGKGIRRFYMLENVSMNTIRAFHGHLRESKYVLVVSGKALICAASFNPVKKPDKEKDVYMFELSSKDPSILYIPKGFANGSRFLEENTKVMVFSDATLDESKNDEYRLPYDYWGKEIWQI